MLPELLESGKALCPMTFSRRGLLLTRIILLVIRPRNGHLYGGEMTAIYCMRISQGLTQKSNQGKNQGKMTEISNRMHSHLPYLSLRHFGRCCIFLVYVHYATDTNIF